MNRVFPLLAIWMLLPFALLAQSSFDYTVELKPVTVAGLPGLHSYAFAQHGGKWLLIGGRKDGIHPRQPFNAFATAQNNTDIYVVDIQSGQKWSASVTGLPTALAEQLQSTNMNFHQVADTLYIIGGYAYSPTAADHITFPNLTTVDVPGLIQAVVNNSPISTYFKQMTDTAFAVTGGHLNVIGDVFYLVGGHKFTGRYNPMGNPTYIQAYTNQIRKFRINNTGTLSISDYTTITDPVHLRRRDYNLLPQIFPDGTEGFTISSGVFQLTADLPFLYPVDIKASGHTAITGFNQYLSNYHSATASLYDSATNAMHNLFFGGISQYYYQNGLLIKDDNVPFVKTISRLTRKSDGTLQEFQLPVEMPGLKGSSAEFILNPQVAHYESEIIKMHSFSGDTVMIGHILGGISSTDPNAFANNSVSSTAADNTIYEVWLIKGANADVEVIEGKKDYGMDVYPNPAKSSINIKLQNTDFKYADYYLSSVDGRILVHGSFTVNEVMNGVYKLPLPESIPAQPVFLTMSFDNLHFSTITLNKL
ncbi:MAG: hypothetical protein H3C54_05160 [Taibaiella sp.]|nr:hypothetical protein [Taibaiella sp.]